MTDRNEKIISLAREMLRSDMITKQQPLKDDKRKVSFRVICLTTLLTATGSSAATGWMIESHRPINHYERTELDALIFYTAHERNIDESFLRREVAVHLNLDNLEDLNLADFRIARSYLQNRAR